MSGYELSRKWFAFVYETKGVRPVHTALYFWIIERANASGWKSIIDIQTEKSMECLGVSDWRTYRNALQFLTDNGFVKWIEKSKNQYTCNRISLVGNMVIDGEAMRNAYANNAEPDAEAIAEAIAEAYAKPYVKAIAEALQSYINPKTTKPLNKETSKPSSLHQSAIAAFHENYLQRFDIKYVFSGAKDGAAVKSLLEKIKKKIGEAGREATDEATLAGFRYFLGSVTDKWVLDNFSPALLNSKFNELFKSAKNGKENTGPGKATAGANGIDLGLIARMGRGHSENPDRYAAPDGRGQNGAGQKADVPHHGPGHWGYADEHIKAAG